MVADGAAAMRLDKWLWCARFFKSRALASEFCEAVGVRVAGQPVRKAHYQVRIGDVLTFSRRDEEAARVIRIQGLSERRLSAPLARELYEDLAPPPAEPKTARPPPAESRPPGAGRPTKADRRATDRLKGNGGSD